MSTAETHTFRLSYCQKGPLNICPEVSRYEVMGILRLLMEMHRINGDNSCDCSKMVHLLILVCM
jgi:hypothetical protein